MTDCYSSSCATESRPRKKQCPVNGRLYASVSTTTIKHYIKEPWNWKKKDQGYYFCDEPECDVVYFGQDDEVIDKTCLRTPVGIKENMKNSIVCYCFGITIAEATNNPEVRNFVLEEVKEQTCACEARNPSGRCCLKHFPLV
jgi:hypothetical protein